MDQWKDYIVWLLKTNDKAVLRAAMIVYRNGCRNLDRMNNGGEKLQNYGFNRWDNEHLIPIIEEYIAKNHLSDRKLQYLRQGMLKYWRQILDVILKKRSFEEVNERKVKSVSCPCEYGYCGECEYGQ